MYILSNPRKLTRTNFNDSTAFVWMCDYLSIVEQESCKTLLFCEVSNTILWTNSCFGYSSTYPATNTVNSKSVV